MIKGLIFDFDGLILDTEEPEYRAWQEIYAGFGQTLRFDDWAQTIGSNHDKFNPITHLEDTTGISLNYSKILNQQQQRSLRYVTKQKLLPGVMELITGAKQQGYKLAIASSSPWKWVGWNLTRFELLQTFSYICTGDDVERIKPEPDLFLCALYKMGLSSNEAIAFEDAPLGIQAAKEAGLTCIAIPNEMTRRLDVSKADLILDNLELPIENIIELLHTD
jgi:HAD superfamily hydrolase (TIGR01509 family)